MTAPASDSGRPDSVNHPSAAPGGNDSAGGSSVKRRSPEVHDEPTSITRLPLPANSDDTPTIISAGRPRTQGPDSQLVESLAGRKLGHFELIESVGVGGMAAVIKARDLDLARIVALKILPPDMAVDPENVTRFKQEARAAAKLDHENIARVYFCGEDQGLHFIAFEFVEGETLRALMERRGGMLPVGESVSYLVQVTAGLVHAASRGVVHRDIKPSNIIITPEGKAKIVDMGLARNLDPHSVNGGVTQSGVTLGTFDYISPEQAIEPRSADTRSDIYSLGCTFYHVLTGVVPVPEGTAAKKLYAHQHVAPVDPRILAPAVPDELAAILGRMMAKDPAQRYQTPEHLLQHLLNLADRLRLNTGSVRREVSPSVRNYSDDPLPRPPGLSPLWVGTAVVALLVVAVGFSGGLSGPDRDPIDQPPLWGAIDPTSGPKKNEPDLQNLPVPNKTVADDEPKTAKNAAELVSLLTQNVARIHLLPGGEYDLTRARGSESLPEALFQGKELVLQGTDPQRPAIVKLKALPDDGKTPRRGSLTLRGNPENGSSSVLIRNVIFQIHRDSGGDASGSVGIGVRQFDRVDFDRCTFEPSAELVESDSRYAAVGLTGASAKGTIPKFTALNSYFARGDVGIRSQGRSRIEVLECAVAPQAKLVEVQHGSPAETTTDRAPSVVRLEHCSVFLQDGSVVEIGERVPCVVQAGFNIFSIPGGHDEGQRAVVRQIGERAPEFKFEARLDGRPAPNGYHNVQPYQDVQQYTLAECKQHKIPFADPQAKTLFEPWTRAGGQSPEWTAENLALARAAFEPNVQNRQLIVADRRPLLGLKSFLGVELYADQEVIKPKDELRLTDRQRAWYPSATSPLAPNVYRTLPEALANWPQGGTLLLHFNGEQKIDSHFFSKLDTDVTLKADEGFKPVLSLNVKESTEAVMFTLKSGRLALDGIQFRLGPLVRSLVAMPRGAECGFLNCAVTLGDDGDGLSVVTITDSSAEAMTMPLAPTETKNPAPKVTFANSFVRGKGRLLYVRPSKSFDLDVKNSLVVLDGSLVEIDPSSADPGLAAPAQIRLHQMTAYFSGHLLDLEANAKQTENKGVGLVRLNCQATNCVLMPATTTEPMILLRNLDTENQVREVFSWEGGRNNLYGFAGKQELLRYQPENVDGMMPKKYDRDEWLTLTSESAKSFTGFKFSYQPPEVGKSFSRPGKNEFTVLPLERDPFPKLDEGASYGATLSGVPNAE